MENRIRQLREGGGGNTGNLGDRIRNNTAAA